MQTVTDGSGRVHPLAQANIDVLEQGRALLADLSDDLYVRTAPPLFNSAVGRHMRHNLEHVASFAAGFPSGKVDYDDRPREIRLEVDREHAIRRLAVLVQQLRAVTVGTGARLLLVKLDCAVGETPQVEWSRSSVKRELQFLSSHTVHHFAQMALILRHAGYEPGETFGMAPSTLRHRGTGSPCAR